VGDLCFVGVLGALWGLGIGDVAMIVWGRPGWVTAKLWNALQ
jgi:hypothetical protein